MSTVAIGFIIGMICIAMGFDAPDVPEVKVESEEETLRKKMEQDIKKQESRSRALAQAQMFNQQFKGGPTPPSTGLRP